MKDEVTIIDPKEFGLNQTQAEQITSGLSQILEERKTLSEMYQEVIKLEITEENIPKFKELRLSIRDNRTKGIEMWHKVNKEFYLRGGQFVDSIKRKEVAENERMEANLKSNEDYFENLERERLAKLQNERVEKLLPFFEDAAQVDLKSMDEDVFEAYFTAKKNQYDAKVEAEKLEAEKRQAEIEAEQKRIEAQRIENERLKKEAEEREKQLQLEREKAEAERKRLAEIQAKKDAENAEKLRLEREEKQRIENELKAKQEAENKAELERLAELARQTKEAEKLAKAPVKKQLSVWVNSFELPDTLIENELSSEIIEKFNSFKSWSLKQIENL